MLKGPRRNRRVVPRKEEERVPKSSYDTEAPPQESSETLERMLDKSQTGQVGQKFPLLMIFLKTEPLRKRNKSLVHH